VLQVLRRAQTARFQGANRAWCADHPLGAALARGSPMTLESILAKPLSETMTTDVATLTSSLNVQEGARALANNGVSGMPVVDDRGVLVGIATLTDFVSVLSGPRAGEPAKPAGDDRDGLFYDAVQLVSLMDQLVHPSVDVAHLTVGDIMSTRLVTVQATESMRAAAHVMARRRVHRVLVVDPAGKLLGIVSALDVVGLLG
jgi:CBS domain-containing protein